MPIPAVRRVSDNINYGNEGTTGILISPSIAEAHGVHEDDFFQKRTKYEVEEIFKKMNLDLSNFDAIWDSAQGKINMTSFDLKCNIKMLIAKPPFTKSDNFFSDSSATKVF